MLHDLGLEKTVRGLLKPDLYVFLIWPLFTPPPSWLQTLLPAVNELLAAEEWQEWEANLAQLWYDPAELEQLVARHAEWQKMQEQRKQARLEGMLVEAQALENRVEE